MGQQPSKPSEEMARLKVLNEEYDKTKQLLETLQERAIAEAAARIPATPGSDQARADAAFYHWLRLMDERTAIRDRLGECRACSQRVRCPGPAFSDTTLPSRIPLWMRALPAPATPP